MVSGVRDLGGNIEVTGQPVMRASTISAKVEAMRRGARRHRCGNTSMTSKVVGLEASAPCEEPPVLANRFDSSGRASVVEVLAAVVAVFVYEGSADRSTQTVVECLHSNSRRAGRSFPRAASFRSQARDEALRIRLCSVATPSGVFGR